MAAFVCRPHAPVAPVPRGGARPRRDSRPRHHPRHLPAESRGPDRSGHPAWCGSTAGSSRARSADEYQISRPIVGPLARLFGARPLPNMERQGLSVHGGHAAGAGRHDRRRAGGREPALLSVGPPAPAAPRGDPGRQRHGDPGRRPCPRPASSWFARPASGAAASAWRSTARCRASSPRRGAA